MNHTTLTKNQHFISRAEQRLNAKNPNARFEKQRIYSFLVAQSEPRTHRLETPNGAKISGNLAFLDLFTFDVVNRKHRRALEERFHQYEADISTCTRDLLNKLSMPNANIKREVIAIFCAKLLNFLRNPYSVGKVLNTVGIAADYSPAQPTLRRDYERILNGSRPHEERVCAIYGLTPGECQRWLRALFLLLSPADSDGHTFFDQAVKAMLEESRVVVRVNQYGSANPEHTCLLSDRGFVIRSEESPTFCIEFNLTSRAFIQFGFCDVAAFVGPDAPASLVSLLKQRRGVQLLTTTDDLEALALYNSSALHQCHERVFSASKVFLATP